MTAPAAPDQVVATRLPAKMYAELAEKARAGERTVAAELRLAVRAHLRPKPKRGAAA